MLLQATGARSGATGAAQSQIVTSRHQQQLPHRRQRSSSSIHAAVAVAAAPGSQRLS